MEMVAEGINLPVEPPLSPALAPAVDSSEKSTKQWLPVPEISSWG